MDTLQAAMNQLDAQQDKAVDFVVGHTENEDLKLFSAVCISSV